MHDEPCNVYSVPCGWVPTLALPSIPAPASPPPPAMAPEDCQAIQCVPRRASMSLILCLKPLKLFTNIADDELSRSSGEAWGRQEAENSPELR
jgi:hypothetical protein